MDPSQPPSFTSMLNSSVQESENQNKYYQQLQASHFAMNIHASFQYPPNQHPHHPSIPPFAHQPGIQQYPYNLGNMPYGGSHLQMNTRTPTNLPYGGAQGHLSSSPVESPAFFGAYGVGGSRGEDSCSPMSAAQNRYYQNEVEESRDSSPEEEVKRNRNNWSKQENERLVNAWIKHSVDPIQGNGKKSDYYWSQVVEEYNKSSPPNERRSTSQIKGHWSKTTPLVTQFHACYIRTTDVYASGQSEVDLMKKVHAMYLNQAKVKKAFALEYWWEIVRKEPKWRNTYLKENQDGKRQRLDALGAYNSSSNQDSEETDAVREQRPQGTKAAKEAAKARKGKVKQKEKEVPTNSMPFHISDETSELLREGQDRKAAALEKWAEATTAKAVANREMAEARKEQTKVDKFNMYMEMMKVDTLSFSDVQLQRHEKMVEFLCKEFQGCTTSYASFTSQPECKISYSDAC